MKNPWIIIGIITIVLFGGAILLSNQSASKNNEGVTVTEHIKGNPESTVVLEEFSDLQCPACASFAPVVKETLVQFGDQVRFEYKHFPLPIHQYALQASVAAEAAGLQGKFFEFHDMLFDRQQEWAQSAVPASFFSKYAEELELDVEQFERQSKSTVLRDKVQAELAEGRDRGVNGTPTFFLNGKKMEYNTVEEFIAAIAAAVAPAATSTNVAADGDVEFGI